MSRSKYLALALLGGLTVPAVPALAYDAKSNDTRSNDTRSNDTGTNDTQNNDTGMKDTRSGNTHMNDSRTNDTGMNASRTNDTRTNAKAIEPEKMTCDDFLALDEVTRPKVIYWAEGYNHKGKPDAFIFDTEKVDQLVPTMVEVCSKDPKASFWHRTKSEAKKNQ